jgi:rubrerythrin
VRPEGGGDLFELGTRSTAEALAYALSNELEAISLYERQAASTDDPKTASILQLLAETEREHAQYLQLQLDILKGEGRQA